MKLYYSPGACSFAPHVLLNELGIPFSLVRVEHKYKKTAEGENYLEINPKGYVPALKFDDGQVMTEGVAILHYLADLKPDAGLTPKPGTMERYRLLEMMTFLTTELHKGFSPLFIADRMVANPEGNTQLRDSTKATLARRFGYLNDLLLKTPFLMGDKMTIADIYAMTILRWCAYVGIDMAPWPALQGYLSRMQDRPSVQAAIKAEGLKG